MKATICVQCAMKAFIEGRDYEPTDETPTQHMRRLHNDPAATDRERAMLLEQAAEKVALLHRQARLDAMKERGEFN